MPRYAFYVIMACALGGCDGSEDSEPHCVCKPSMKIEWEPSTHHICNNATFDWLLGTVLGQVSRQSESLESQATELEELRTNAQESTVSLESLRAQLEEKDQFMQESTVSLESLRAQLEERDQFIQHLTSSNTELKDYNVQLQDELDQVMVDQARVNIQPKDCADVQRYGFHYSGIYTVYPSGLDPMEVFCDLNSDGGGWLVIQRRQDGTQNFARNWADYREGFGILAKEFWLGNEKIHALSQQRATELRVDITDFEGKRYHAHYDLFAVEGEENLYRLHLGDYQGDAGNAFGHHNNHPFSTSDMDNDKSRSGNCAELYGGGGWWWVRCYDSNLNGLYGNKHAYEAIVWYHLRNNHEPLRHVEMKIRPAGFGNM